MAGIDNDLTRAEALRDIVVAQVGAGKLAEAERIAAEIEDDADRSRALRETALALR